MWSPEHNQKQYADEKKKKKEKKRKKETNKQNCINEKYLHSELS